MQLLSFIVLLVIPKTLYVLIKCNKINNMYGHRYLWLSILQGNIYQLFNILPKIDELKILMANEKCADILGLCETFLDPSIMDQQVAIEGYEFLRKDRMDTRNKTGGGLILYLKSSLKYKRMHEYEISKIETIWAEIELPNAKPFLVCSVYRPPNVQSDWIDLFEEELCIAQATGLEFILMGDFNIDLNTCTNNKFINMLQVFDLTQFVREPTRVTQTSSTLIDHVYSSHPENILACFVSDISISDHFPVCFSRKINNRIPKIKHQKTSYRCFKHFNEVNFLRDLSQDLNMFTSDQQTINADMDRWSSIMVQHLNTHAPIKSKHVKSSRLPDWFSPDIKNMQKLRDKYKRLKQWSEYKTYRNKTRQLIRASKRKYFSESISKSKDSKHIWSHLRTLNGDSMASNKRLPEEIIINNECITQSNDIAQKLNEYFTSIADILNQNDNETSTLNTEKMTQFVNEKCQITHFLTYPIYLLSKSLIILISSTAPRQRV